MSYEAINQELQIYSCGVEDLTLEQVGHILSNWDESIAIKELIVFYDYDGRIILNKDCEQFDRLKSFIPKYTGHSLNDRQECKEKAKTATLKMILDIIDNALLSREKKKKDEEFKSLKKLLEKQSIPFSVLQTLWNIYDSHEPGKCSLALINLYTYGVIQGKRAERAKKKSMKREIIHKKE